MFLQVLLGSVVGIASGVRHAIEPDHLAAVSTLAAEEPRTRDAVRFAAAWGLGHALMLLIVGGALVVTRREMPMPLVDAFELVVAATLMVLGGRALLRARTLRSATQREGKPNVARPLFVGVVHGLAGSGAITALALSTLGSALQAIAFVALYGLGATLGMAMLAGIAGPPLARLARSDRAFKALVAATGCVSLAIGAGWGVQAFVRLV